MTADGDQGEASIPGATAALREVLRQVEAGELAASPGLVRLVQGAALGLEQQERLAHQNDTGAEPYE